MILSCYDDFVFGSSVVDESSSNDVSYFKHVLT